MNGFPPFLLRSAKLRCALIVAIGLLGMPGLATSTSSTDGYRLAGVVAVGNSQLGFLELPQGGQVLVKLGTVVNGGRVVAFDGKVLRIRFPDRTLELQLQGSGKPPTPDSHAIVTERQEIAGGSASFQTVDVAALQQAVDAGSKKGGSGATAQKGATGPVATTDKASAVAARFEPLFQLPLGARVVAINEAPVASADAAILTVESSLERGRVARLTIRTNAGESRIYLRPQRPDSSP